MIIKPPYTCPCCGYFTNRKDAMFKHFNLAKMCCLIAPNALVLTDEIKKFVMDNRVLQDAQVIRKRTERAALKASSLLAATQDAHSDSMKKPESFYQAIVEKYLGGTHMPLNNHTVTDVTTDVIHAEIKH